MKTPITSFKDLIVWKNGMEIANNIYVLTKQLPKEEQFGLTSQMRRAAISIPSNIAEGHQQKSTKHYIQFLRLAKGSAAELETQLLLARDNYNSDIATLMKQIIDEQRMLAALIARLSRI